MEYQQENDRWMSIPQFGGWDQTKGGKMTNYSMVFSQVRANRKQNKCYINRHSFGNERELLNKKEEDDPVIRKRKILTYLNCCIKA